MSDVLFLCTIDAAYLKTMHKADWRVEVKVNNRPFVGIVTLLDGKPYAIPLTSQTTQLRKASGKKKRSSETTTFIRDDNGEEIADLLYNNMIPVTIDLCHRVEIDPAKSSLPVSSEIPNKK